MNSLDDTNDALDPVLRAYFRAEMPHPWPGPPARYRTMLPPRRESGWLAWASSSRFALALSLGLLLTGAWMLSGLVGNPDAGKLPTTGAGTAGKDKMPPMPPELKDQLEQKK